MRVTLERQQMIDYTEQDLDVVALMRAGASGMLLLLQIRRGRWLSTVRFPFADTQAPSDDLIRQFVAQHYSSGADVPPLVLLPRKHAPRARKARIWNRLRSGLPSFTERRCA